MVTERMFCVRTIVFQVVHGAHLSFIVSLPLIVSVATTALGFAIKANNPNGEVK